MSLKNLNNITKDLNPSDRMSALFLGHGNPMNALEDNEYTRAWIKLASETPKPQVILCISAHWLTKGTLVTVMEKPRTIHDFGGFPDELFQVQYPCEGSPQFAKEVQEVVSKTKVLPDTDWGIDHGTWSVLKRMYPEADIPVIQLSIDYSKPAQYHYDLAVELRSLRNKGVLIIGSGNIVHNLQLANFGATEPYDWATEFDEKIKGFLLNHDHQQIIDYQNHGSVAKLSVPTPDHYYPLMYTLGLDEKNEELNFPVEGMAFGSGSMRCVRIG